MKKFLGAMLALITLGACATHPKSATLPVAIHRIAIIPATNPRWYTLENAAPPVGYPFQFWVNKIDSHSKAYRFNEGVDPRKAELAAVITSVVAERLTSQGYAVEVLHDLLRPVDDPDNLDEEHAAASVQTDAIVHIWIEEVGMYSGHLSTKYVPRINIGGKLWIKNHEDSLYSDVVYYGVDARKGKSWAITPDEKYRWGSFDDLMLHIDDVREAYEAGTRLAAQKLAEQISNAASVENTRAGGTATVAKID
jgi:hypothetical protein